MSRLPALAASFLLLLGAYALAEPMTSGRPSAVLNETQCQEVWKKAVPNGDKLAQADATSYIVNFTQIDTDGDGVISITEFQAACGKGLVKYTDH